MNYKYEIGSCKKKNIYNVFALSAILAHGRNLIGGILADHYCQNTAKLFLYFKKQTIMQLQQQVSNIQHIKRTLSLFNAKIETLFPGRFSKIDLF